jgi:hypothetical protein
MSENQKRILEMLAANKISVDESMRLLAALGESTASGEAAGKPKAQYLRVVVNHIDDESGKPEKVNVRVPVALIRAGMKFTSLIPKEAGEEVNKALEDKGININLKNLKEEDIDGLVAALSDLEVDIDEGKGKVKVYTE